MHPNPHGPLPAGGLKLHSSAGLAHCLSAGAERSHGSPVFAFHVGSLGASVCASCAADDEVPLPSDAEAQAANWTQANAVKIKWEKLDFII